MQTKMNSFFYSSKYKYDGYNFESKQVPVKKIVHKIFKTLAANIHIKKKNEGLNKCADECFRTENMIL